MKRDLIRGLAKPSDLGTALDELAIGQGQAFSVERTATADPHACVFCGGAINHVSDYRRVEGFERHRSEGGTNALALRKATEEWACSACVDRAKRGVSPTQQALVA